MHDYADSRSASTEDRSRSPPFRTSAKVGYVKSRLTGNASAGNAYNVADMASFLQAVCNAARTTWSSSACWSDFSQWGLCEQHPDSSRLNGLSIANVASSHSYDLDRRRCAVRRSLAWSTGGARRSTRAPEHAVGRRRAPTPPGHRRAAGLPFSRCVARCPTWWHTAARTSTDR
jgi:hypothetical protein